MRTIDQILAKHRRASAHLELLETEVKDFLSSEPFHEVKGFNEGRTEWTIRIENVRTPPESIPLLVGDTVHNARATLDHLAHELAHETTRHTYFPILLKKDDSSLPKIHGGTTDGVREILERHQPYYGDSPLSQRHPLYVLNELDIMDKHRLLITAISASNSATYAMYVAGQFVNCSPKWVFGPLTDGTVVCRIPIPPEYAEADVQIRGRIIPEVTLDPGIFGMDPPESVTHMLRRILQRVEGTVRSFSDILEA